jgi:hypothetical protein
MQSIYPCLQRRDQIKLKYTSSAAEIIFHEKTLDHAVKISRRNGRWVRTGIEPWRPAGEGGGEGESLEATAPQPIGSMRSGISYRVRLRWLYLAFHQLSRHACSCPGWRIDAWHG